MSANTALDETENFTVDLVYQYLKTAMPEVTKEQARNMVAKIGVRIMFGAEIYDEAMEKKRTEKTV